MHAACGVDGYDGSVLGTGGRERAGAGANSSAADSCDLFSLAGEQPRMSAQTGTEARRLSCMTATVRYQGKVTFTGAAPRKSGGSLAEAGADGYVQLKGPSGPKDGISRHPVRTTTMDMTHILLTAGMFLLGTLILVSIYGIYRMISDVETELLEISSREQAARFWQDFQQALNERVSSQVK